MRMAVIGGSGFNLRPPTVLDAGKAVTAKSVDNTEPLFSTSGRLYFMPDFETDGVTIEFDDDDATPGNETLATVRLSPVRS